VASAYKHSRAIAIQCGYWPFSTNFGTIPIDVGLATSLTPNPPASTPRGHGKNKAQQPSSSAQRNKTHVPRLPTKHGRSILICSSYKKKRYYNYGAKFLLSHSKLYPGYKLDAKRITIPEEDCL
jgi:hypothetical protein